MRPAVNRTPTSNPDLVQGFFIPPTVGRVCRERSDFYCGKTAKWWIPDDVIFLDELPHTATGKLSKKTLREKYRDYAVAALAASAQAGD